MYNYNKRRRKNTQREGVYMLFFNIFKRPKQGIVNVKMIITEEKILSNIDKVQRLINPNSKKQIIELEDDAYFKDLIDSVKVYLVEYPNKKSFPASVYKASHELVEYATNQFEDNTKQIEVLIRQRENNINIANELRLALEAVQDKDKDWKNKVKAIGEIVSEDIVEALTIIGKTRGKIPDNYEDAVKLVNARINNLETNLHIEIDMERIEDRSKALSYIGIEIAEALRDIPAPMYDEEQEETTKEEMVEEEEVQNEEEFAEFIEETRFEVKPTLWQRIKQSKFVQVLKNITRIRVVLDVPALPEGREEN